MIRNWLTVLVILASVPLTYAQTNAVARARIPDRSELDRLNLRLAWTVYLPIEGVRDGIATVQVIPVADRYRKDAETAIVVAQTRSGTISVFDAATGRRLWSRRPAPAYPAFIPEVGYDPRGALLVVRDLNLYRFDVYPTTASIGADENEGKLTTFPAMPSSGAVAVVGDATKGESLILVCFGGSRLVVYGRAPDVKRARTDTSVLEWKKRPEPESDIRFKPGDNKFPSLTMMSSLFGPDYGTNDRSPNPEPKAPSLTMVQNLSRPNLPSDEIASTPSLTMVQNFSELTELSRRDVRQEMIEASSRHGDYLDFRLIQDPKAIRMSTINERGQAGIVTKVVLVGTDRNLQIDVASEKRGLTIDKQIGSDVIRSTIAGPAGFRGNSVFLATQDGTIRSIDAEFGLLTWSTALQVLPVSRPAIVGQNVFIASRQGKLFRLNSDDGTLPTEGSFASDGSYPDVSVKQFLAASDRYAYALDKLSQIVVLDRKRGTPQGQLDVSGFTSAYLNDVTDRIILASNDGKIICLHDVAMPTQKLYRSSTIIRGPAAEAPPAEGAKPGAETSPEKPAEKPADKAPAKAGETSK
jgi:outer membrane protein assembly factor BamB